MLFGQKQVRFCVTLFGQKQVGFCVMLFGQKQVRFCQIGMRRKTVPLSYKNQSLLFKKIPNKVTTIVYKKTLRRQLFPRVGKNKQTYIKNQNTFIQAIISRQCDDGWLMPAADRINP